MEHKHEKYKTRYINCSNELEHLKLLMNPPIILDSCGMIDYYNSYNFPLTEEDEKLFNEWIDNTSKELNRDLRREQFDYDFRIFWKTKKEFVNGHFNDIGKKPNHITFSNESFWNGVINETEQRQFGGSWNEEIFTPSPQMLADYKFMEQLRDSGVMLSIPEPELISFPEFEIAGLKETLNKFGMISTHRICNEYGKYKLGQIYFHSKLGKLRVVSINDLINIKYSPVYRTDFTNWTKKQQEELIKYGYMRVQYIQLEKG